ncbi:MAG: hypothetical protein KGL39_49450 [Patescibacteria group bacterium]|nr:hypothetical protein [Patescibacteria group bacterium]
MMDATRARIDVRSYATGDYIGTIEMNAAEWERYAVGEHPDYQWPEGIAEAGKVLSSADITRLSIGDDIVIWLED